MDLPRTSFSRSSSWAGQSGEPASRLPKANTPSASIQKQHIAPAQKIVLRRNPHYWRCLCCFTKHGSKFVRKIVYAVTIIFVVYGITALGFGASFYHKQTRNATVEWLFFASPIVAFGGADEGESNGADFVGWILVPLFLDILPAILLGVGGKLLQSFCCILASCLFFVGSIHDVAQFLVMVLALLMEAMLKCHNCQAKDFAALAICMMVRIGFIIIRQFSFNLACAFREQINNGEYDKPIVLNAQVPSSAFDNLPFETA